MKWSTRKLMYTQLDEKLAALKDLSGFMIPRGGWLRTLRTTLGMTSKQLAKRCGVVEQRIRRIERDEVHQKTTLQTLNEVAAKLDCDFVYAFVPKTSIADIIENQAEQKAKEKLSSIAHSMSLEAQGLNDKSNKLQLDMLKKELVERHLKSIWE